MLKKISIDIEFFNFEVDVYVGSYKSFAEYMETTDMELPDIENAGGWCAEYEPCACMIWVSELQYLPHEISHAADRLLAHIGVKDDSCAASEIRAYCCGFLTDKIKEALDTKLAKRYTKGVWK